MDSDKSQTNPVANTPSVVPQPAQATTQPQAETPKSSFIAKFFKNNKALKFLSIAILVAAVPVTVFTALHQQDVRQHAAGCGASCPVVSSVTNLITNPSFESGIAGWSSNGNNPAPIEATMSGKFGGHSLMAMTDANGNLGARTTGTQLTPGIYTASAWVFAPTGTGMTLAISRPDFRTVLSRTSFTGVAGWQYVTTTFTVPVNEKEYIIIAGVNPSGGGAFPFYIDGVQLETGSKASAYCDGSNPGGMWTSAQWNGAANNSTSACSGARQIFPITNLLPNPGFEYGISGWSSNDSASGGSVPSTDTGGIGARVQIAHVGFAQLTLSTTQAKYGTKSLSVTTNTIGNDGARIASPVQVLKNVAYTASGWVTAPQGASMKLISYRPDFKTIIGTTTFTGTGSWQKVALTFVAADTEGEYIQFQGTVTQKQFTFYLDGVQLEQAPSANPYCDGLSTGGGMNYGQYYWSTTPSGTTSVCLDAKPMTPFINSITPSSARIGSTITIQGSNFDTYQAPDGTKGFVWIKLPSGPGTVPIVTNWSNSSITFTIPNNSFLANQTVQISVNTWNRLVSNEVSFKILP